MSLAYCPTRAVFDVETGRIDSPYAAPLTVISIITTDNGKRYQFYEDNIREAVDLLLACPGYVTYNGLQLDLPVMLKYMSRGEGRKFQSKPHFDIFHELQVQYPGLKIALNNFAKTTLGETKIESETGPIEEWIANPRKLELYNMQDTILTYKLYLYYCSFGYLKFKYPLERTFVPETISRPSKSYS